MSMRTALMEMANNEATQYKKGDKVTVKVAKSSDPEMRQHAKEFGDKIGGVVQFQSGSIVSVKTSKGVLNPSVKDVIKESVDYGSRMTDAQKKKFHDLKKKMTGGPEYQKIMRKNQSPVKSDDEFHNLVLKKVMSEERAAWVPESIADEQVEAFMEATVAAIAEGEDTFVFEGKHYKAKTKKEDKLDPVGQEDDDIDNDGDVDSSDKYLKKRRSAIKKSMDEEKMAGWIAVYNGKKMEIPKSAADGIYQAKQLAIKHFKVPKSKQGLLAIKPGYNESVEENYTDKQDASYRDEPTPKGAQKRLKALHKKALAYRKKHGKFPSDPYSAAKKSKVDLKFESTETIDEAMSGTYMTVEYDYSDDYGMLELYKNGKKVGSWSGDLDSHSSGNPLAIEATKLAKKHGVNPNGLKTIDGENPKRTGKLSPNKDFGFPVQKAKRESVEESSGTAQHGPDDATSDTFQKQMGGGRSPREKEFVDMHKMEVALDVNKIHDDNKKNIEAGLKASPARMGDNLKNGDTSFVSPLKADIIDGITKALQQMKTNS